MKDALQSAPPPAALDVWQRPVLMLHQMTSPRLAKDVRSSQIGKFELLQRLFLY